MLRLLMLIVANSSLFLPQSLIEICMAWFIIAMASFLCMVFPVIITFLTIKNNTMATQGKKVLNVKVTMAKKSGQQADFFYSV